MVIKKISNVVRCSRLRWMGHVLRKEGNDWVKEYGDDCIRSRGREDQK